MYELSGPEALTGKEAAEISVDDWARRERAQGLTEESIEWLLTSVQSMRDGYFEPHDGVQKVLGREPRRFEESVLEAAVTGAWGPVQAD